MAKIDRECYFDLPVSDQVDLLQSLAPAMGRRAEILEKDIWLCQVLDILFQLPCRKPMAFKGGTSLSKVYKAIDRFSEDIDVTVDYRSLVVDAPELESITSNSQRGRLSVATRPCHRALSPSRRILPNTSPTWPYRPRKSPCYLRYAPSGRRPR